MGVMKFTKSNRSSWIRQIIDFYENYAKYLDDNHCTFDFDSNIKIEEIEPFHIVTLACLNQYLHDQNIKPYMSKNNESLFNYLYNDLQMAKYFVANKNHVANSNCENVLNLWRIKDTEKDAYAIKIEAYFKKLFEGKDIYSISLILKESFYNVFDHAQAGNNAFTFVQLKDNFIYVAVADFGIGIVNSVKKAYPNISDKKAIENALVYGFTAGSTQRNKGYGMENMMTSAFRTRIYSDKYFVVCEKNNNFAKITHELQYKFPGTLLYFEIDTNDLENEEIVENFEF